jgi:hypothetical protein
MDREICWGDILQDIYFEDQEADGRMMLNSY